MILLLDTSTPTCRLHLAGATDSAFEWEAGRTLAHGLLTYLKDSLASVDAAWADITGIVAYRGPGSFTGLRIGLTVLNTLADAQGIPIVGAHGDSWKEDGMARLRQGENDTIILPFYGAEPHITTPKR